MQDPMQPPEQNPGPDPGPNLGPGAGEQPGPPMPGPMPGQYPGPGPGPYPGPTLGQKAGGGASPDPPSARPLRMAVIALGALCLVLLIAGTAVDEYTGYIKTGNLASQTTSEWWGCQKIITRSNDKYSREAMHIKYPFKYMNKLSFIIILTTSFLCLLQAAATALNMVVLRLGKLHKVSLIVSSTIPLLLLLVIVLANINFSKRRFEAQVKALPHYLKALLEAKAAKETTTTRAPRGIGKRSLGDHDPHGGPGDLRPSAGEPNLDQLLKSSSWKLLDTWGSSYDLICAAFVFAVINQILLMALHKIAKNDGVATFGAFVKTVLNPAKMVRLVIFLINLLLLAAMIAGIGLDSYIDGGVDGPCMIGAMSDRCNGLATETDTVNIQQEKIKSGKSMDVVMEEMKEDFAKLAPLFREAHALAIVLFALTVLVCLLLAAATALCLVQMALDKNLTLPLLGVSGVSALFLLISVVIACFEFKLNNHNNTAVLGLRVSAADVLQSDSLKMEPTKDVKFAVSFHILATALAFALVNAGLNALNMLVLNKGGNAPAKPAPNTMKVSSTQPSSTGVGPSPLEATCQNPTASA